MQARTRICKKCRIPKPLTAEEFYPSTRDGFQRRCKDCDRARNKIRTVRDKEPIRELLRQLKSAPCMDCGGSFPSVCMHYDHRDPLTKRAPVSAWVSRRDVVSMLEEIALCDLVCANCHAIRTEVRRLASLANVGTHHAPGGPMIRDPFEPPAGSFADLVEQDRREIRDNIKRVLTQEEVADQAAAEADLARTYPED